MSLAKYIRTVHWYQTYKNKYIQKSQELSLIWSLSNIFPGASEYVVLGENYNQTSTSVDYIDKFIFFFFTKAIL